MLKLNMLGYIRDGALGSIGEWKLKDCITVHKLLGTVLVDHNAALSKYQNSLLLLAYDDAFEQLHKS